MLDIGEIVAHNKRKEGRGTMQNLALPAEVATPSPEPSRTRYQEVRPPLTQRRSPQGRAAKNNAYEGISLLVFSFWSLSCRTDATTRTKVTTTISFLFVGCPTQRPLQVPPLSSCQRGKVEHPLNHKNPRN